jgi:hypothetical protein
MERRVKEIEILYMEGAKKSKKWKKKIESN